MHPAVTRKRDEVRKEFLIRNLATVLPFIVAQASRLCVYPVNLLRLRRPDSKTWTTLPERSSPTSHRVPDRDDYQEHPTTALLIAEVSQTTLAFDRRDKASLSAKAGIADYWIVNLIDRQLGVFRNPIPDENQPYDFGCSEKTFPKTILKTDDSITPLTTPESPISIADLLR